MQQKYLITIKKVPLVILDHEMIDDDDDKTIVALIMEKHNPKYNLYVRKGANFTYQIGKKEYEGKIMKVFVEKNKFFVQKGEEYLPIQL